MAQTIRDLLVSIAPVNDAPVVAKLLPDVTVLEDTAVSITIPAGSFTDVDNASLTYAATLADGTALPSWLKLTGSIIAGTPPMNFNGALDIKVTASDGALSANDVFRLAVSAVNDAPVLANNGPISVIHNDVTAVAVADLLANDVDIDGDRLSILRSATRQTAWRQSERMALSAIRLIAAMRVTTPSSTR